MAVQCYAEYEDFTESTESTEFTEFIDFSEFTEHADTTTETTTPKKTDFIGFPSPFITVSNMWMALATWVGDVLKFVGIFI
ncbi:hypothetical protein R5R35_013765 [Gryllus longicercus]|uniref:Uncharacterized protein n=1 Tax=Gryllus longicercus TaxID=2509291 RepID=A0AAN9WIT2_9ORTH